MCWQLTRPSGRCGGGRCHSPIPTIPSLSPHRQNGGPSPVFMSVCMCHVTYCAFPQKPECTLADRSFAVGTLAEVSFTQLKSCDIIQLSCDPACSCWMEWGAIPANCWSSTLSLSRLCPTRRTRSAVMQCMPWDYWQPMVSQRCRGGHQLDQAV